MKKTAICILIQILGLAFANSAPTDLDTNFGTNGKVTTPVVTSRNAFLLDAKLLGDGRIIGVGSSGTGANFDFALARFDADGSLDTSFTGTGTGGTLSGTVTTNFGGNEQANSVVIQIDGKIVAAGTTTTGTSSAFALARYNTNGSLDSTFNSTGALARDAGTCNGVVVQSNGQLVAAGSSSNGTNADFALFRYNADGSTDTTFGTAGKVLTDFGGTDAINSIALQTDGKIVVAGTTSNGVNSSFALARYNTNGSLDTTFNGTGLVTTVFSGFDIANSIVLQTDGKIVVAGATGNGYSSQFALARYNTNGSLDVTFNGTGKVATSFTGIDAAFRVVLQSNGKLLVAGSSSNGTDTDFSLARYNGDGSLDTTFSSTGNVITDILGFDDVARAVGVLSNGQIVLAGSANDGALSEFALVRYDGGSLNPPVSSSSSNASYGLLTNTSPNVYTSAELGTLSFSNSQWAYSSYLAGWLWGNGTSNYLYSYGYGFLYASGDGDHWYLSSVLGWIYTGNFSGAVWSSRFGWVWPIRDATYFYSWYYGWLTSIGNGQFYSWNYGVVNL